MTINIRQLSSGIVAGGRLTIGSDPAVDPNTTGTTLYYRPYSGNQISLYNGSSWYAQSLPGTDISITTGGLSSSTNYDVFVYVTAGVPTLELVAWSGDTTRSTALTRQDGVLVKSGTTTKRYLGTVRTNGSTQFEDSVTKRFVWNVANRVVRHLQRVESTASWSYSTDTWRQANNSASNQVECVRGLADDCLFVDLTVVVSQPSSNWTSIAIALDSLSVVSAASSGNPNAAQTNDVLTATYTGAPSIGYHYVAWLERVSSGGSAAFLGTNAGAPSNSNSGLRGTLNT